MDRSVYSRRPLRSSDWLPGKFGVRTFVSTSRIALISPGGVLAQIIRTTLEREPGLELIPEDLSLTAATASGRLDLVILVLPGADAAGRCRELLQRFPGLRALMVLEDSRGDASLYELHPTEARLGRLSPAELAQRIRATLHATGPQ
jgi:hypothetical protein